MMLNVVSYLFCCLCLSELCFLKVCVCPVSAPFPASQILRSACWHSVKWSPSSPVTIQLIRTDSDVAHGSLNLDLFLCRLSSSHCQFVWETVPSALCDPEVTPSHVTSPHNPL